jgi:uncharacterized protein (TIGR03067 family)
MQWYHRLDAGKDPKQIDIAGQLNGATVIKGIYVLDGDELRLYLGGAGKDRPAAFPKQPGPGEQLLILHRQKPVAEPPKAKVEPPAKTDQERMVGGWVIASNDGQRSRKGEVWSISKDQIDMNANLTGFKVYWHHHRLDATKDPKQIDITVKKSNGEFIGLIKGIYAFADDDTELRLCLGEMGKDRPTAFAGKPGESEFLILRGGDPAAWHRKAAKEEKLRVLIDKVLAAHGGEEKLNKLKFTEKVKQTQDDNLTTIEYFVQPPDRFRAELQRKGDATKQIHILEDGIGRWTKYPDGRVEKLKLSGAEPPIAYWLDYVRFFGPRVVLRLKDTEHRVSLLEEVKIAGRPAVGVELNKAVPDFKLSLRLFFDKETNLLVRQDNVLSSSSISYSDYKKFDGISIAQKQMQTANGKVVMEAEVTDFQAVDKFDAKLFEQP